jgi:hypothetical protein
VSVRLHYLIRAGEARQNRDHLAFWRDYFESQGAEVERVDRVFGDG